MKINKTRILRDQWDGSVGKGARGRLNDMSSVLGSLREGERKGGRVD